jgi:single-stranded DNA-binding protein
MADEQSTPTINLAIVRGSASGPPEIRQLPSGRRVATFSVRTHALGPPATSVPVAAWDPPAWIEAVDEGDELIVAGSVRRRFYRAVTGSLASRVELEAAVVGRAAESRKVRRARHLAEEALEALE